MRGQRFSDVKGFAQDPMAVGGSCLGQDRLASRGDHSERLLWLLLKTAAEEAGPLFGFSPLGYRGGWRGDGSRSAPTRPGLSCLPRELTKQL